MARIYGARAASRAYRDRARARRRAVLRGCLKWLFYAAFAVLLCAAEGVVFSFFGASAVQAAPYLLPAWVTAVAMYEGYVGGAWFGIAVGLLSSAAGGDALYLLPLLYMLYGLTVGMLGTRFLKKGFFIYAGYEIAVCAVHGLIRLGISAVCALIEKEGTGAVMALLRTAAIRDFLASAAPALLLYLPLLLIRRITAAREQGQDAL